MKSNPANQLLVNLMKGRTDSEDCLRTMNMLIMSGMIGSEDCIEIMNFLINQKGANVNKLLVNILNDMSESEICIEIMNSLFNQKGANVDYLEWRGVAKSILMIAVERRNTQAVELLLRKGANIDLLCGYGDSALKIAIKTKNKPMVELLINKGAKINQDTLEADVLEAAFRVDYDIAKLLIEKGAKVTTSHKDSAELIKGGIKQKIIELINEHYDENNDGEVHQCDKRSRDPLQYH